MRPPELGSNENSANCAADTRTRRCNRIANVSYEIAVEREWNRSFSAARIAKWPGAVNCVCRLSCCLYVRCLCLLLSLAPVLLVIQRCVANANERAPIRSGIRTMQRNFGGQYATEEYANLTAKPHAARCIDKTRTGKMQLLQGLRTLGPTFLLRFLHGKR